MLGVTSLPSNPSLHHVQNGSVAPANCAFTFPDYPANFDVKDVAINLSLNGHPVYRSTVFTYARARQGGLDIYINQPVLPPADAIAAGEISQHLGGAGLPSNTTLTSGPTGIWVAGDQQGANVQFGVKLVPHTSTNLNVFADIGLNGWNIHVGFPADCKLNADEILAKIKTMLATDDFGGQRLHKDQGDAVFDRDRRNLREPGLCDHLDHLHQHRFPDQAQLAAQRRQGHDRHHHDRSDHRLSAEVVKWI